MIDLEPSENRAFSFNLAKGFGMELMIVNDVMVTERGQVVITGPLLMKKVLSRAEVEQAFGVSVNVSTISGEQVLLPVKGIRVSQAMSGAFQVSAGVDCPSELYGVIMEGVVHSEG